MSFTFKTFVNFKKLRFALAHKKFKFYFRILVSSLLIIFLFSKVQITQILHEIDNISWGPVLLILILGHIDRILMGLKWKLLANSSGLKVTNYEAIASTYMGNFAALFMPSGIGGDIARIFLLKNRELPGIEMASSIVVERTIGFISLITTGLLAFSIGELLGLDTPFKLNWKIKLFLVSLIIAPLLSFYFPYKKNTDNNAVVENTSRFKNKIGIFIESYQKYINKKLILIIFFMLSVIEIYVLCLLPYLGSLAFDIDIKLIQFLMIFPIILLLIKIPISINGIGIQEGLLVYYFHTIDKSTENAVLLGVLLRLMQILILIPGGALYFYWKKKASV